MPPPDSTGLFNLIQPDQIRLLSRMIVNIRPALVIVDSLVAATARAETSLKVTHDLLGGLSALAREARTALLVVHHLRKRAASGWDPAAPRAATDDLRGTSHLSAAARSILALTPLTLQHAAVPKVLPTNRRFAAVPPTSSRPGSPESAKPPTYQPTPDLRLEVLKSNLCRLPPPLALTFEDQDAPLPQASGLPGCPDRPSCRSTTDLWSARFAAVPTLHYSEYTEPPPPPTQIELCARWLLDFLAAAGAPAKPVDVVRAAIAEGFSRATVYRARQALADLVVDLGNSLYDPNKRWTLAPQSPAAGEEPSDQGTTS